MNKQALLNLVQSTALSDTTSLLSSTISGQFPQVPTPGDLLVAIVAHPEGGSPGATPSGWSVALDSTGSSHGHVVYFKQAGDSESRTFSLGVDLGLLSLLLTRTHSIQLLEFSGFDGSNAPTVASATASSSKTFSYPSVTTTGPALILASSIHEKSSLFTTLSSVGSWTDGFTTLSGSSGVSVAGVRVATAHRIVDAAGTYSTQNTANTNSDARGDSLVFELLPDPVTELAVTAATEHNLITFNATQSTATQVMVLAKTADCSFSATPQGSESSGTAVGNATVIFNAAPSADLSTTAVTVGGSSTTVSYVADDRALTHAQLAGGTTYCYRMFARKGLALDSISRSAPTTRAATPMGASDVAAPAFVVDSESPTLSAASIVWGSGAVYADGSGKLLTVRSSGLPKFGAYQLPDMVQSRGPAGVLTGDTDATFFASALDGDAYALWASGSSAGTLRWSTAAIDGNSSLAGDQALGDALYAAPLVSNTLSRVFVGTRNTTGSENRIFALNATTGACAWVFNGTCSGTTSSLNVGQISGTPLLDVGNYRLLFTSTQLNSGPTVWAIDAHDSASGDRVLWSRSLGESDSALTFTDYSRGAILVGTNAGRVYKLDPSDGSTCWGSDADGCGSSLGTEEFFCADPAVDARATSCSAGSAIQKSLIMLSGGFVGYIAFSTADGNIRVLDATGQQLWRTYISGASTPLALPSVGGGKLYVGGDDGTVHELAIADGSITGTRSAGGGTVVVGAPAFDGQGGLLHVNTSQGYQYAFTVPF